MKSREGKDRLVELKSLTEQYGLRLDIYSPTHCRIFKGAVCVDYWPTSGKAWRTGSGEKSRGLTPKQTVDFLRSLPHAQTLPEGSKEHLQSIKHEDVLPWEGPDELNL